MSRYIDADRLEMVIAKTWDAIVKTHESGEHELPEDTINGSYAAFQTVINMIELAPSIDISEQKEGNN